jgi:hypothetical protein
MGNDIIKLYRRTMRILITILFTFACLSGFAQVKTIASRKSAPKPIAAPLTAGPVVEYTDTLNIQWLRRQKKQVAVDEWKFLRYDTTVSPTEIDIYSVFVQGNKTDNRLYKRILKKK